MIGHNHADIFNQEKFLLNGVEMQLQLVGSRSIVHLISSSAASNFRGQIKETTLLLRRINLNPGILLAYNKALEMSTAKYLITRADCKAITIAAGIQIKSIENIFLGNYLNVVLLALLATKHITKIIVLIRLTFKTIKLIICHYV